MLFLRSVIYFVGNIFTNFLIKTKYILNVFKNNFNGTTTDTYKYIFCTFEELFVPT